MLVEDDDSLREIYSIRLTAEGYQIVMAHDGEEALAVAVKERPDLIITDAMMPKISGFDMLDILRSTPEMKDIKVIIMTALSSDEQRARGENLGANRYLVKSQVGIEDVVNVVHEVLGDRALGATDETKPEGTGAETAQTAIEVPAEGSMTQVAAMPQVGPTGPQGVQMAAGPQVNPQGAATIPTNYSGPAPIA